jgi:hypothetical protein
MMDTRDHGRQCTTDIRSWQRCVDQASIEPTADAEYGNPVRVLCNHAL